MPTLKEAAKQAMEWIATKPEDRQVSAGRMVGILTLALEAEQQAEQVTWYHKHWGEGDDIFYLPTDTIPDGATPLYTHPQPPRQPLTDGEVKMLIPDGDEWKYEVGFAEATEFARAIERTHGITGETK